MAASILNQLRRPLIALVLGVIPFFVFLGSSQTVTVNGVLVRDEQFNLGGLVLAAVGLWLAVSSVRPMAKRARAGLAVVAAIVCIAQLIVSAGIVPRSTITGWMARDEGLPVLAYSGLDAANRGIPDGIVASSDEPALRRAILNYAANTQIDVDQHVAYADSCFGGRYRLDVEAMRAVPDELSDVDRQELAARVEANRLPEPVPCSDSQTAYRMGELVDGAKQKLDMVGILVAGYRDKFGAGNGN